MFIKYATTLTTSCLPDRLEGERLPGAPGVKFSTCTGNSRKIMLHLVVRVVITTPTIVRASLWLYQYLDLCAVERLCTLEKHGGSKAVWTFEHVNTVWNNDLTYITHIRNLIS